MTHRASGEQGGRAEADSDEAQLRAAVERFFEANPDTGVIDALGTLGTLTLSPDHREFVEDIQPDTDTDADADTGSESAGESAGDGSADSGSGARVVHRSESHDVYIGRGRGGDGHLNNTEIGETGWLGNPYKLDGQDGGYSRKQSIALYWGDLNYRIEHDPEFVRALAQLKDQRLACYCRRSHEDEPDCHGDVLVRTIEGLRPVNEAAGRADSPSVSESGAGSAVGSVDGER